MKPLDILSGLPHWAKASPDAIIDSPAFAMPCRLGDEPVLLRPASIEPAASGMLALSVKFGDEPHTLRIARSQRFPDLDKLWDVRGDVPEPILLALVEKECGPIFQLLENAVRKQLRLTGMDDSAQAAPVQNVPPPDSEETGGFLSFGLGDICFSITRSPTVVSALGVMRNLDLDHESIRLQTLPAEIEYAAFQLPEADLASLAPGDAVLLPEIGSVAPRLIVDGRLALDANGVVAHQEDALVRVRAAKGREISLGELFDSAEGSRGDAEARNGLDSGAFASLRDGEPVQMRLVRSGKTLATGRLDRIGDSPAFIVETPNP